MLLWIRIFYFNSHAHVERDLHVQSLAEQPTDFNSHAHVERDFIGVYRTLTIGISTHTLTWSVTRYGSYFEVLRWNFNSHAHVERDLFVAGIRVHTHFISTHTLTWSVTILTAFTAKALKFQLTRSRGA